MSTTLLGHRVGTSGLVLLKDDGNLRVVRTPEDDHELSHGEISVRQGRTGEEVSKTWTSSLNCAETEKALRSAMASEGLHVSFLLSQGAIKSTEEGKELK